MMTLRNMRQKGVRTLSVRCLRCCREVVFDVGGYSDEVTVPSFGPRMVCRCAARSTRTPDRIGASERHRACLDRTAW